MLKVQIWFCVASARDSAPCQKWVKREGFVTCPKTMAGVGDLKRIWKNAFRVAGAGQETCSSEMLGGQGADFLRGVGFWSIRPSGLLRWFCVTGAALNDLASLFRGRRSTLDTWSGGIAKRIGTRPSVAELLRFSTLSSSKIEEVLPNCCASDVVTFKNWGSLAG